jgi:hypothetical protein
MILGNRDGVPYRLEQTGSAPVVESSQPGQIGDGPSGLLRLLTGIADEVEISRRETGWRLARVEV